MAERYAYTTVLSRAPAGPYAVTTTESANTSRYDVSASGSSTTSTTTLARPAVSPPIRNGVPEYPGAVHSPPRSSSSATRAPRPPASELIGT